MLDFADNVVIVCGSRTYESGTEIGKQLEMLPKGTWVVHGDYEDGADRICRDICLEYGIPAMACPANWDYYGAGAGPIRNSMMLRDYQPNAGLAFHDKKHLEDSRGTFDMVSKMRDAGVFVRVFGLDTPIKKLAKWRRRGIYG